MFAAALLASGRYDPLLGAANSWLYRIVSHKLASASKRGAVERRARRRLAMEPVELESDDAEWIASLAAEGGEPATGLLAQLPADQRTLVAARVIDERAYDELAREHGIAEATVRKRVSRGLATLRSRLTEGETTR